MLTLSQQSRPSYSNGYSRSRWESAYPCLWDGLIAAWMPVLGPSTQGLVDVSQNGQSLSATGVTPWVMTEHGYGIQFADNVIKSAASVESIGTGDRTFTLLFEWDIAAYMLDSATAPDLLSDRVLGALGTQPGFVIGRSGNAGVAADAIFFAVDDGSSDYANRCFQMSIGFNFASFCWDNLTGSIRCFKSGSELSSNYESADATGGTVAGKTIGSSGTLKIGQRPASTDRDYQDILGAVLIHDRVLTETEIETLHNDILAPFRQSRYLPFATSLSSFQPAWARNATQIIQPVGIGAA